MMIVKYDFLSAISAIAFDDFNTVRYSKNRRDIIYPIFDALRKYNVKVGKEDFLREYFKVDKAYRKSLKETFRESLLDNIIVDVLTSLGCESPRLESTVVEAVNEGLATRNALWYSDALSVLNALRKNGYRMALVSNTHWRILAETRKEFEEYFDVITLSYEHGYVKPHPSIFLVTLKKLNVSADYCLYVGDDPIADVQGAKTVGIKTVFIKRRKKIANAGIEIRRLSELIKLLGIL